MTITAKQLENRGRGLGSSDAHVLAGVDGPGHRTMLDLWATKRRGKHLEIAPLVESSHDDDKASHFGHLHAMKLSPMAVGNSFEASLIDLYRNATGNATIDSDTCQHPEHEWMRAHPDQFIIERDPEVGECGLEAKMVGKWGADRWGSDGIPEYVLCQVQWCMAVTGYEAWDIVAWIAGTDVRIARIQRDEGIIEGLTQLGESFWTKHVLANEPPPPESGEDLVRLLGRRYPQDDGLIVAAPPEAAPIAARLEKLQAASKKMKARVEEEKAKLIAMVGPNKGIEGPWGKFNHPGRAGSVSWKKVAESLGDPIDLDLIEQFRGASFRVPRLYPFKAKR